MSELKSHETHEGSAHRLTGPYSRFLTAWASNHTGMEDIGLLPFDPETYRFQAIDHFMTPAMAETNELNPQAYEKMVRYNYEGSFEDPAQAVAFVDRLLSPIPEGGGRSYVEILAEDYLDKGLGVAAILGHPEDRLTDSPRFLAALNIALFKKYGLRYAAQMGLVVGAPLKLETYKGTPIDTVLSLAGRNYYTLTQSDNTEKYRKEAGISPEELEEISSFVNLGVGRIIMADSLPKDDSMGRLVAVNPTATRAHIQQGAGGQIESVGLKTVSRNTARLLGNFSAYWPVAVVGDQIEIGPIIPLDNIGRQGLRREEKIELTLSRVEDAMEIVTKLVDAALGQRGVTKYHRQSERGAIYNQYSETARFGENIG